MSHFQALAINKGDAWSGPIRTTIYQLIDELSRLTENDNLVVAAVKDIFSSHDVKFQRSLAPVKLTVAKRSH